MASQSTAPSAPRPPTPPTTARNPDQSEASNQASLGRTWKIHELGLLIVTKRMEHEASLNHTAGDANAPSQGAFPNIQTNEDKDSPLSCSHDTSKDSPATRVKNLPKDDFSLGTSFEKRSDHNERGTGHNSERGGCPQKYTSGYPSYSSRDSGNGRESRTSAGGRGESRTPGGRRDRDRRSRDSDDSMHDHRDGQHPSTSLERHLQDSSRSRHMNLSSGTVASTEGRDDGDGGSAEEPGYQIDWETSFVLVSTARPLSHHGSVPEASTAIQLHEDWGSLGEGSSQMRTSAGGPFRMVLDEDPRVVQ